MIPVNAFDDMITKLHRANPDLTEEQAAKAMIDIGDTPELSDDDSEVLAVIDGEERWLKWPWGKLS